MLFSIEAKVITLLCKRPHIYIILKNLLLVMNEKNSFEEFYLDDLLDGPDSYSGSDSGDESDDSDIIIRKRSSILPLRYNDSEDDEMSNNLKTIQIMLMITMTYGRQTTIQ